MLRNMRQLKLLVFLFQFISQTPLQRQQEPSMETPTTIMDKFINLRRELANLTQTLTWEKKFPFLLFAKQVVNFPITNE